MPVKNDELERLLGWPQGLDNLSAEEQLPIGKVGRGGTVQGSLRVAENVDLDEQGKVSSREGFSLVEALAELHSLWADPMFPYMLAVYDGDLVAFDTNEERTEATALSAPDQPMSYAFHAGWVYYTNGFDCGRFNGEERQEWAVFPPLGMPTISAFGAGGLFAGTYQVAITYIDADGRESGSCEIQQVELTEGQGIAMTAIPQPSDASVAYIRVYASKANHPLLYSVRDLPVGATTFIIGVHEPGKQLDTAFLEPLPPGHMVRFHNGRQYVFRNKELYWSEALMPGQSNLASSYLTFNERGALCEGVGEGPEAALFVAAGKRTYLFSGPDPKKWARRIAHPHGAVEGSAVQVDATLLGLERSGKVPFWLGNDGQFVIGTPAGVQPLHKDRYAAETGVERASTVLRETRGMRHILSVLKGGTVSGLAATDTAEAEVWRDGVRIS